MKQLTEQQILDNWNKLIQLIEDTFQGERKDKILEMYKYFEDRMSVAPASGKAAYHNALFKLKSCGSLMALRLTSPMKNLYSLLCITT